MRIDKTLSSSWKVLQPVSPNYLDFYVVGHNFLAEDFKKDFAPSASPSTKDHRKVNSQVTTWNTLLVKIVFCLVADDTSSPLF